ncbi:stage III sporulation protein AF [Desulfosporosinus fructosivorans]|uniref:Stage III sporulation protein AF n=1 Tax=Desulfosporosinus fructosivorans TaxID=2018669 RepID=A0A4Z0R5J7_9FIRM|nr:stage III sporulation protein AF [Desulfosporosinus fructosivorans]TGE37814.1 stage III sporulation protein AF [Desulfosporosinus fructosivorans]
MQTLHTLVRNLAVILLLATFLEMLLPNKSMRGFVQMVMGLFVISAVLAPITTFLHTPLDMDIPAWSATTPQDLPAIATEGQGLKLARDAVQEQYRQILVNQIKALALGSDGVEGAEVEVEVEFEEGSGGLTDQPKIVLVKVTLTSTKEEILSVQPITIGHPPLATENQSPRANNARERISEIMSISKDKIIVQEGKAK